MTEAKTQGGRVFGRTFSELDQLAKQAVRRSVENLHAKGIATFHRDEQGRMVETAPDGSSTTVAADAERGA